MKTQNGNTVGNTVCNPQDWDNKGKRLKLSETKRDITCLVLVPPWLRRGA